MEYRPPDPRKRKEENEGEARGREGRGEPLSRDTLADDWHPRVEFLCLERLSLVPPSPWLVLTSVPLGSPTSQHVSMGLSD